MLEHRGSITQRGKESIQLYFFAFGLPTIVEQQMEGLGPIVETYGFRHDQ